MKDCQLKKTKYIFIYLIIRANGSRCLAGVDDDPSQTLGRHFVILQFHKFFLIFILWSSHSPVSPANGRYQRLQGAIFDQNQCSGQSKLELLDLI